MTTSVIMMRIVRILLHFYIINISIISQLLLYLGIFVSEDTLSSRRHERHRLASRESAGSSSRRSLGMSGGSRIVGAVRVRMWVVKVTLRVVEGLGSPFFVATSLGTEELGVLAVDIVKVQVHVGAGLRVRG